MSEEKIYQPKWEEHKERERRRHEEDEHYYESHRPSRSSRHTNSWGGAMKLKDKQAYYGLMFIVLAALASGAFWVVMQFVHEWRAMPHDDPSTEMKVDELDIHKVDKHEALLKGDSIAKTYQFDSSTIHRVQTESHHVYRPPRKNKEWYITEREWQDIFKNLKRWKKSKKNDEQFKEVEKEKE